MAFFKYRFIEDKSLLLSEFFNCVKSACRIKEFQRSELKIFMSDSNSVTATKSAWTRQYVWQFLNDYGYRSGIKSKIGAHTLRKTFGYHAYKNGVDLSLLMRIFNHSSQAVTLRYIGITQDQIDDVYINLDKIL